MTKKNLNMPGSSVKRIEKGCDALLLPYEDIAEAIRSHFSGTVFSHVLLSKAFGEEYGLSRIPIEMRGEARLVAGLFRIDCYYGDLPGEKPMTVAFVRDSGYEVPNKDCLFHLVLSIIQQAWEFHQVNHSFLFLYHNTEESNHFYPNTEKVFLPFQNLGYFRHKTF